MFEVGSRVGAYRIVGVLGTGGGGLYSIRTGSDADMEMELPNGPRVEP